jgi:hypothetical protein
MRWIELKYTLILPYPNLFRGAGAAAASAAYGIADRIVIVALEGRSWTWQACKSWDWRSRKRRPQV